MLSFTHKVFKNIKIIKTGLTQYMMLESMKDTTQICMRIDNLLSNVRTSIHPFSVPFYPQSGHGGLEPIPANSGCEAEYTLDRSPVHRRATQRQTSTYTLIPTGNLE